jgi:hypothetical protein
MNGGGRRYLAGPQTRSPGFSDLHSGKAEVRDDSEMKRFINRANDRHNVQINVGSKKAGDEMKLCFINVRMKTK